jgi:malonate-semialdehyde dehydrogenase (acetylating) / methylmalonate-semialdehyde dehydrogenase
MGAKNHGVILPDANREDAINALVGATFGASGQRCMALTTVILVGDAGNWVDDIAGQARNLNVSDGFDP